MRFIELRGVRKSYGSGEAEVEVLRGVDLAIEPGEFVAITGPSGSGKTTCLEILGTLSRPTEGTYYFEGRAVQTLRDEELAALRARRMGFVFQSFNLIRQMSAVRNASLAMLYTGVARAERERRASAMLERVGLGHRLKHTPRQLSGGEQQRVAIARALVNDPRVIFADEPTGNLDGVNGRAILDLLCELHREGRTLVVVTHSADVAEAADRIVSIRDGQIVEDHRRV